MNELCDIGQELWENSVGKNYNEQRYKKYVEHISQCIECKKGLEIDRVISEEELTPVDD